MATLLRQQSHTISALLTTPQRFDFFQAIRLLKQLQPESAIHYKSHAALNFASADIIQLTAQDEDYTLLLSFIGLTGQNAALPDHFTETVLKQQYNKDRSLRDFFDLFNQRITELFYAIWENNHFFARYEQDRQNIFIDSTLRLLQALTGTPQTARQKTNIKQEVRLFYAGLFANQTRSATALAQLLSDYFETCITVESFGSTRHPIPQQYQSRLSQQHNNQLGKSLVLGQYAWDMQNSFSLLVNLDSYQQLRQFLPNRPYMKAMQQLTELFIGQTYNYQITLNIQQDQLPMCQLRSDNSLQLGWNTCLQSKPSYRRIPITVSVDPWVFNYYHRGSTHEHNKNLN